MIRAQFFASQLMGVVMARYIVQVEPFASLPPEQIVATIGPNLQRYLTGICRTAFGNEAGVLVPRRRRAPPRISKHRDAVPRCGKRDAVAGCNEQLVIHEQQRTPVFGADRILSSESSSIVSRCWPLSSDRTPASAGGTGCCLYRNTDVTPGLGIPALAGH